MEITKDNAKTKGDIAALLFAHKLDDFHSFIALAEEMLDRYASQSGISKAQFLNNDILRNIIAKVAHDVHEKGFGGCSVSMHYANIWMKNNEEWLRSKLKPASAKSIDDCRDEVARKFHINSQSSYKDWAEMYTYLININPAVLIGRLEQAMQLYVSQFSADAIELPNKKQLSQWLDSLGEKIPENGSIKDSIYWSHKTFNWLRHEITSKPNNKKEEEIDCPFCDGEGYVPIKENISERTPCGYCFCAGRITTKLMKEHIEESKIIDEEENSDDLPF